MLRIIFLLVACAMLMGAAPSQPHRFALLPVEYAVFSFKGGKYETFMNKSVLRIDSQTGKTWGLKAKTDSLGYREFWVEVYEQDPRP